MTKHILFAALLSLPLFVVAQTSLTLTITGHDAKCNGSTNGSATAAATGGTAPYSYYWAPVADTTDSIGGLVAGVYSVTVVDSVGDSISNAITIHQPAPLSVTIDSEVVAPCFRTTGGAVCGCENTLWAVVSGGTPPYSYLWSPGSSSASSSDTSDTLAYACYVVFTVNVTDSNGCTVADSLNIVAPNEGAGITSGVAQVNNTHQISIYPNPANSQLNIGTSQTAGVVKTLRVYNMLGEMLYQQSPGSGASLISIDISGLASGNYLLKAGGDEWQETLPFSIAR